MKWTWFRKGMPLHCLRYLVEYKAQFRSAGNCEESHFQSAQFHQVVQFQLQLVVAVKDFRKLVTQVKVQAKDFQEIADKIQYSAH